jgi:hypothetical protein
VTDEPPPPLLARLRAMPGAGSARLRVACGLAEDPGRVVNEILATVEQLRVEGGPGLTVGRAGRSPGPARPAALWRELDEVTHRERGARTPDVAFWLERERRLTVVGDPDLDGDYVDRELVLSRGLPFTRVAVRIDLLLASADGGRPIVAEVKIAGDGDPYVGLVQALAGVACLGTPARYAALRARYPDADFPDAASPPPLDAYVLGVDSDWAAPRRRPMLEAVKEIARGISADPRSLPVIRRAVVLQLRRDLTREWSHAERQ